MASILIITGLAFALAYLWYCDRGKSWPSTIVKTVPLLAFAMAALGLNIHWRDLLQAGWRPVVLALLLWLILLLGGALLCRLLMAGG